MTPSPPDQLRVREGFTLADLDPRATPGFEGGKAEGKKALAGGGKGLSELQERLFAEGRGGGTRSVLLVVQGMDTSGKGGIMRHVVGRSTRRASSSRRSRRRPPRSCRTTSSGGSAVPCPIRG